MTRRPKPPTPKHPTQHGVPLTEELLDRLADEAEAGFDEGRIRRPGRPRLSPGEGPSAVVQVRVEEELQRRLTRRAMHEGTTLSEVVRNALRAHLAGAELD